MTTIILYPISQVAVVESGSLCRALEQLMLKHPNKNRGQTNLLLWTVNTVMDHLHVPQPLSTGMLYR